MLRTKPAERFVVYGLLDPDEGIIRYVGMTGSPRTRLRSHEYHSKVEPLDRPIKAWIRALGTRGTRTRFVEMVTCPNEDDGFATERSVIALLRPLGNLLNETSGGRGIRDHVLTDKQRRNISAAVRRGTRRDIRSLSDHDLREIERRKRYQRSVHTDAGRAAISIANAGEANHQAKITADDVREMRRLMDEGVMNIEIVQRFGVSPSQVSRIRRGHSWKGVA